MDTKSWVFVGIIIVIFVALFITQSGIITEKVKQDVPQGELEISLWLKTDIECDTSMDCVDFYEGLLGQAGESVPEKTLIEILRCADKICEVKI